MACGTGGPTFLKCSENVLCESGLAVLAPYVCLQIAAVQLEFFHFVGLAKNAYECLFVIHDSCVNMCLDASPSPCAGPAVVWRPGRADDVDGSKIVPDGRLPDATQVRP